MYYHCSHHHYSQSVRHPPKQPPKQLELLISRSRGRPNKDLAKLADQIRQVMEKWDA